MPTSRICDNFKYCLPEGHVLILFSKNMDMKQEQTFIMIKPDGVRRGLTGDIISRIERVGLKLVAISMVQADEEKIDQHLPKEEAWITRLGEKTLKTYEKYGFDAQAELGTTDKKEIGLEVRKWLTQYLTSGPMVKMIVQGMHAIDMGRKMAGNTIPAFAEMGTIRGDYSVDSPALANREKRAIFNMMHASETPEEAENEINLWFGGKDKAFDYPRTDENLGA